MIYHIFVKLKHFHPEPAQWLIHITDNKASFPVSVMVRSRMAQEIQVSVSITQDETNNNNGGHPVAHFFPLGFRYLYPKYLMLLERRLQAVKRNTTSYLQLSFVVTIFSQSWPSANRGPKMVKFSPA